MIFQKASICKTLFIKARLVSFVELDTSAPMC